MTEEPCPHTFLPAQLGWNEWCRTFFIDEKAHSNVLAYLTNMGFIPHGSRLVRAGIEEAESTEVLHLRGVGAWQGTVFHCLSQNEAVEMLRLAEASDKYAGLVLKMGAAGSALGALGSVLIEHEGYSHFQLVLGGACLGIAIGGGLEAHLRGPILDSLERFRPFPLADYQFAIPRAVISDAEGIAPEIIALISPPKQYMFTPGEVEHCTGIKPSCSYCKEDATAGFVAQVVPAESWAIQKMLGLYGMNCCATLEQCQETVPIQVYACRKHEMPFAMFHTLVTKHREIDRGTVNAAYNWI
ncbi:MAG: hypothetical protein ABIG95_01610 [Candidatus Woesearchaeota archaeon]